MAASCQDGDHAVFHPHQGRRSVHVAVRGEEVEVADASSCVYLLYLTAGQPAQDVEVVDVEVAEDAARCGDVLFGWRVGVVGGEPQRVDGSESAGFYEASRFGVAGIEASLEADLERRTGGLDLLSYLDGLLVSQGYRLLAESRGACFDGGSDQRRVSRGRGGDDDGIGPGAEHGFDPACLPSDFLCNLLGALHIGVADEYLIHSGVAGQHSGVEGADTAGSEQSDFHPTPSLERGAELLLHYLETCRSRLLWPARHSPSQSRKGSAPRWHPCPPR